MEKDLIAIKGCSGQEGATMPVVYEKTGRLVSIIWDRPPLNVFDISLLSELHTVLSACSARDDVDIVVLRGAGSRAFSAGVDIRDHTIEKVPEMLDAVHSVIRKLIALPQVSIAAVCGVCLGGGLEIASSCDFVVASEGSSFATPEVLVGCYRSCRLLSASRAGAICRFDRVSSRRRDDSHRPPLLRQGGSNGGPNQPCVRRRSISKRSRIVV
jgi:enoyl-CoA hydratase/carnithine racemase